jgi:uncharacterized protein (DUF302 family)
MSLVSAKSPDGVSATVDRLVAELERRHIEVFARVDHGAGARAAGLELADEELLIFGDARVGTLLMQSDRSIGYELPLRVLVWDEERTTRIAYRPARELPSSYDVADRVEVLARMDELLESLIAEITAQP